MPAERAPMRKVREVLRLRHTLGVSEQQIAVTVGVSSSTVGEYLRRAAVIGISWQVPEGMDDGELERRLFTPPTFEETRTKPLPYWSQAQAALGLVDEIDGPAHSTKSPVPHRSTIASWRPPTFSLLTAKAPERVDWFRRWALISRTRRRIVWSKNSPGARENP